MACSCNSTPCLCIPACDTDCPEIIDYTFTNVNLTGVGTYDGTVGQEVQFRGVASANSNISVSLDGANNTVLLTLLDSTLKGTATFNNDAARAAAVPAFNGQLGAQLDTDVAYVSSGVGAGDWVRLLREGTNTFTTGQSLTFTSAGTGSITLTSGGITPITFQASSGGLQFTQAGSGNITFTLAGTAGGGIIVNGSETVSLTNLGGLVVGTGPVRISGTSALNLDVATGATLQISGVAVPADSVLITTAVAGVPTSVTIANNFLTSFNVNAAWASPTGTESRATFDTATVTVSQLAERVYALLQDLNGLLKPSY